MNFDLFLGHNNNEKEIVGRTAARLLDEFSIRCWLDEWDLTLPTKTRATVGQPLPSLLNS